MTLPLKLATNNGIATLLSTISAGTMSLTSGAGQGALFPTADFKITLKDYSAGVLISQEIVTITSRTGDVFTIGTRASEACPRTATSLAQVTTAYTFNAYTDSLNGTVIEHNMTAGFSADVNNELTSLSTNKLDISDYLSGAKLFASSVTGNDSYAVTIAGITSYAQINGQVIRVKCDVINTGGATLEINSLGVKTIVRYGGAALQDGDIRAGQIAQLVWDNVQDVFELKDAIDQSASIVASNMVDTSFYAGEVINSGQAVFIEPCISQEYSVTDSENSTTPTSLSGSVSDARGFKMLQNITATVTHITKTSSCTATRAIIANNAGTTLATATFVGNVAVFAVPYLITSTTVWRVLCDNNGSLYTAYFGGNTQARTIANYTTGSIAGVDNANGWNIDAIGYGTTNIAGLTLQNIGDVTANTRVAIPVFGTGANFTTLNLALRKFVSPGVDLGVRIETDSAGNPSGTIVTNGSTTVTSASLTTGLVDTTVTFGGNVNLTIGQRFWIVLFAGTYGSETINATNYFAVGYDNTDHTTTRPIRIRNATVYSAGPTFMAYVSSTGILRDILSLTDADYSYKTQYHGISNESVPVGGLPKIIVNGIYSGTGFTRGSIYYLSQTPGAITTTAPTNAFQIAQGISSSNIYLGGYFSNQRYIQAVASDELCASANSVDQTISATATKAKEIRMRISGTIRISFEMKKDSFPATAARGQIYINGVAVGTLKTTTVNTYTKYTEDIYVRDGDLVQLYISLASAGSLPDYGTYRNFRIYYSKSLLGRETDVLLD